MKKEKIVKINFILLTISIILNYLSFNKPYGNKNYVVSNIDINNISEVSAAIKTKNKNKFTIEQTNALNEPYKFDLIQITSHDNKQEEKFRWHLPTENGNISRYESYWHLAIDLTSPKGIYEGIYPIAPGIITNIYTDPAGAKTVIIQHKVNGKDYSSQYVHLSSYAPNIYVGKKVGIYDRLGQMGATGMATGVHLHIAVVECRLFDKTDSRCSDWNRFTNYSRRRFNEGFNGLSSLMNVPISWTSR